MVNEGREGVIMNRIHSFGVNITFGGLACFLSLTANAQTAPILLSPAQLTIDGPKGTLTQSLTNGTSSSFSFGSTSTLNVSSSLNSTSSTSAVSNSTLTLTPSGGDCPASNCIETRLGYGPENGVLRATMQNSKVLEQSTGASVLTLQNSSSAQAEVSGVKTSNTYTIDGSSSVLSVGLDTLHVNSPEGEHGLTHDGNGQVGSGSAAMASSTNMNVQINNSQFVNVFQQAF